MYKVLIVDSDEEYRDDLIAKITRSGFNFAWVRGEAGFQDALESVHTDPPDILFTDVVLNDGNGLDLIESVKGTAPDVVCAVACASPEFEYAQRALRLGAVDYILKPVTLSQVSAALLKSSTIVEEIRSAGVMAISNYRLEQDLAHREIMSLLSGTGGGDYSRITEELPKDSGLYQVMSFRLRFPRDCTNLEKKALRFGAMNIIEELGNNRLLAVPGTYPGEIVSVYTPDKQSSTFNSQLCESFRQSVEKNLRVWTDLGVSRPRASLDFLAYMESRNMLDCRFYEDPNLYAELTEDSVSPGGRTYASDSDAEPDRNILSESDLPVFRHYLENGDLKNTVQTAQAILGTFRKSGIPGIRNSYAELVNILSRVCYRKGVRIHSAVGHDSITGSVFDKCDTFDEVVRTVEWLLETAMKQWMQGKGDTANVLHQVKQYIEEHFTESQLCTKELAKEFSISLGYLSSSYRKTFGITISKYIIRRRVEYAEHLLLETDLSVQNIAESSGFNNLSYFMRVFKADKNMTPSQYREQNRGKDRHN